MVNPSTFATADRWRALWTRLGSAPPRDDVLERLLAAYAHVNRHYHGLAHLDACLGDLDGARDDAGRPDEIELALWFHDAVYDTHAEDNEERSAQWAERVAHEAGLAADASARVGALVRATRHDGLPRDPDAALICDVDLAILGAPPVAFDAYDRAIREEYAWVPAPLFRARRAEILERFLARPRIYGTSRFYGRLEEAARYNLTRAVVTLRRPGLPGAPA